MLGNFFVDEDETWSDKNVLQKDAENTIQGTYEQWGHFLRKMGTKDTSTCNREEIEISKIHNEEGMLR